MLFVGKLRNLIWNLSLSLSQSLHLPDMKTVLGKCSPAKEWRDADKEGVGPDEDQGEEGGERGGQGELSVLGHHHVPLQD